MLKNLGYCHNFIKMVSVYSSANDICLPVKYQTSRSQTHRRTLTHGEQGATLDLSFRVVAKLVVLSALALLVPV